MWMLPCIMLDLAAFVGGIELLAEKDASAWGILGGALCLLAAVLLTLLIIFRDKLSESVAQREYLYTRESCPHRGESPLYSWLGFGDGYKYHAAATADEDGRTVYKCTECGFSGQANRGTGAFVLDLLELPVHP